MNATANQQWQWERLVKIPRGHKFFRCKLTGRVSACDDGGTLPQYTDDGPLWVQTDKPIVYQEQHQSAQMLASVPVIKEYDGGEFSILSGPREVLWLVRTFGMSIKIQTVDFSGDEPKVDDQLDLVPGTFTKQFVPLGGS